MAAVRTLIILSLLSLLLCACNADIQRSKTIPVLGSGTITQENELVEFDGLSVVGPFDVQVRIIPQQHYMHVSGNTALINFTSHYVKNGVLYVVADQANEYNPNIRMMLTIEVDTLRKLNYKGPGKVHVAELNSDHLILNGEGSGFIQLSGKASRFDATLSGTSRLDAKCLAARTVFVNTVDMAQAEIANNRGTSVLAADSSDVYYYDYPKMVAPYENQSGSVMRMAGIADKNPIPAPVPHMQAQVQMQPAETFIK